MEQKLHDYFDVRKPQLVPFNRYHFVRAFMQPFNKKFFYEGGMLHTGGRKDVTLKLEIMKNETVKIIHSYQQIDYLSMKLF